MTDPGDSAGAGSWAAIRLDVPAAIEEILIGAGGPGCLGAEFRASDSGSGCLTLYFPTRPVAESARPALSGALAAAGIDCAAETIVVGDVADGRWVERYQRSLRPFPIGRGFRIDPRGEGGSSADRRLVHLVPGRAFGTGEHPTTRLCVEALEELVVPGARWLDVGCGSGILSVVAAFCGASEVLAVDHDPEAVAVAERVVRMNGVEGVVEVRRGSPDTAWRPGWDGVVVNIAAAYLKGHARELARLPRSGGALVASGFLTTETDEVCGALSSPAHAEPVLRSLDEWSAAILRRRTERGV